MTGTLLGIFNQNQAVALTVEYLVVAGGGGTCPYSGGAGAGGYRTNYSGTKLTLNLNNNYTCTVCAGGSSGSNTGTKGNNSVFSTITSTGGGFGNAQSSANGGNGGSGGGAGSTDQSATIPGTGNEGGYSPSEGNDGGENNISSPFATGILLPGILLKALFNQFT